MSVSCKYSLDNSLTSIHNKHLYREIKTSMKYLSYSVITGTQIFCLISVSLFKYRCCPVKAVILLLLIKVWNNQGSLDLKEKKVILSACQHRWPKVNMLYGLIRAAFTRWFHLVTTEIMKLFWTSLNIQSRQLVKFVWLRSLYEQFYHFEASLCSSIFSFFKLV